MVPHESVWEEFGLAPMWVRRGTGQAPGLSAARDVAVPTVAQQHVAVTAKPSPDIADAEHRPVPAVRGHAASQADAGPGASAVSRRAAAGSPQPDVRARQATPSAWPEDDASWFDEAPMLPAHPLPDTESALSDGDIHLPVPTLDWDALGERVATCRLCRLCERRTHTVFGVGDRNADWMLIGEAPGENEDRLGEPFVGQAGKLLDSMLHALSLARGKDVYIANVIKCRPPGNRNPEPDEVARCEPYLQRQVALLKPKVIVALGRFAAQSLLRTTSSISSLRGRVHAYEGVPVIVTYHPAYLLRSLHDKSKSWADLCLAQDTWRKAVGGLE